MVTHDFTQKSGDICKLLLYDGNGKKCHIVTSFQRKWVKLYYDAYFINVTLLLFYIHINLEGTFDEKKCPNIHVLLFSSSQADTDFSKSDLDFVIFFYYKSYKLTVLLLLLAFSIVEVTKH